MTFSVQTPHEGHHHPHLACPQCSINSVVQHGSTYICLSCGFHRDVLEPAKSDKSSESTGAMTFLVIVAAILALLVTLPSSPVPNNTTPGHPSSFNQGW